MTPEWVQGPPIGPEALQVAMQPAGTGQKEVYFDSSQLRAAYDSGGGIDPATYQADYRDVSAPAPEQPPIPQEVLDAMRNGQPPPAALMGPPGAPSVAPVFPRQPVPQVNVPPGSIEMTIPVGNGITARVIFTGGPANQIAAIHYRKLIRHLEIEADEESTNGRREERAEVPATIRTGDQPGEPSVPRLVKRRVRKNDRSGPEPGQP